MAFDRELVDTPRFISGYGALANQAITNKMQSPFMQMPLLLLKNALFLFI